MSSHVPGPHVVIEPVPAELMVGTREAFTARLAVVLATGADVVIDFTDARYLDTSGLGALVAIRRRFHEAGHGIALAGVSDDLWALFELASLDDAFPRYPDSRTAAIALVTASPGRAA